VGERKGNTGRDQFLHPATQFLHPETQFLHPETPLLHLATQVLHPEKYENRGKTRKCTFSEVYLTRGACVRMCVRAYSGFV